MMSRPTNPAILAADVRLFEAERPRLRRLAFRLLGSLADAEDVAQEAWLRLSRVRASEAAGSEAGGSLAGGTGPFPKPVADLPAWLTTVTARLALDALRQRHRRAEEGLESDGSKSALDAGASAGYLVGSPPTPEEEVMLADEVGAALLLVMSQLKPAERLAFVLHDAFGHSFDEVAAILGQTPEAARQAASRGRRRVRVKPVTPNAQRGRELVAAFARAAREGDMASLIQILDPDVTLHIDTARLPAGAPREVRGAQAVARRATIGALGRAGQLVLADGQPALAVAPSGRLELLMTFDVSDGRIAGITVITEHARLKEIDLSLVGVPLQ